MVSNIVAYTNSEFITSQMIGIYKVRKQNLKHLHQQAKKSVSLFQSFNIIYWSKFKRVADDILIEETSSWHICVIYVEEPTCAQIIITDIYWYTCSVNEWIVLVIGIGVVMLGVLLWFSYFLWYILATLSPSFLMCLYDIFL